MGGPLVKSIVVPSFDWNANELFPFAGSNEIFGGVSDAVNVLTVLSLLKNKLPSWNAQFVHPSGHGHDCSFGLFVSGSISSLLVFRIEATHTPPRHTSSNRGGADGGGDGVVNKVESSFSAAPAEPEWFSEYVVCTVNNRANTAIAIDRFLNHRGAFMLTDALDYCAVEYINTTLKMKIRMIHIKDKNCQRSKKRSRKEEKNKKVATFQKQHKQLFFFYEKKKIYDLSSDDDDDD